MVKMDPDSTDFHLLQPSLSVPTLETRLDTTDRLRQKVGVESYPYPIKES